MDVKEGVVIPLRGLFPVEEWRKLALCAQADPDLFFPDRGERAPEAKQMCRRCPVQSECLEYALGDRSLEGIWGGFSAAERRILRRAS